LAKNVPPIEADLRLTVIPECSGSPHKYNIEEFSKYPQSEYYAKHYRSLQKTGPVRFKA